MGKTKISRKQKTSLSKTQLKGKGVTKTTQTTGNFALREDINLKEYDPMKNLLDINKMGAAIMQCFIENDTEGVLEIIENYL